MADKPTDEQLERSAAAARSGKARAEKSVPRPSGPANVARSLSPAARPLMAKQVVVHDELGEVAFKMAFLGTGQGGGRMANAFHALGYRRVAVLNTTDMDFGGLADGVHRLNLAVGGAAKDPQFARNSLRGREEEAWDLLTRAWGNEVDYALICVGLGGGTGSGTCVPLIQLARKYLADKGRPPRVGAVVSLPTPAEGQQVAKNAVRSFRELLEARASPLIIVDNARITDLYSQGGKALGFSQLYPTANMAVTQLFHLFNQLAALHSNFITFDRSELAQLLDGGVLVMGAADVPVGEIKSPADISQRMREELTNTVLASVDLTKGRKAACLFVGSQEALDTFSLDYFDAGFTQLGRLVGSSCPEGAEVILHRGVYLGGEDGLQCYIMVSELGPPMGRLAELAKVARLDQYATAKGLAAFLGLQD